MSGLFFEPFYVETGVPGATVATEEVDGVFVDLNGAGSVVGRTYPGWVAFEDETLAERVERLTEELAQAKKALRWEQRKERAADRQAAR